MASRALLDYEGRGICLNPSKGVGEESWMTTPEIPTSAELAGDDDDGDTESIPINRIEGPWKSKAEYARAHYSLLRTDATYSLRASIEEVRDKPEMGEAGDTHIYEKVSRPTP